MTRAVKYILHIALVGIFLGCDTESNIEPRDTNFFVKYYGESGNQFGTEVKALIDGYIIVGSSDSSGVNSDIFVVRTDLQGNELWNNTFGRDANDVGQAIAETATGFVVVGNSENSLGNMDMLVLTIDASGTEMNRRVLGDPSFNDEAVEVIVTQSDNIMIAGASSNTAILPDGAGGTFDFYFPQLQSDLTPVPNWTGRYGFSGEDRAVSVRQKADGDFIFLGTTDKDQPEGSDKAQSNMILFQVTQQGLPNTSDVTFGTSENESASGVANTSDGGFLLVGSSVSENTSKIFLSRVRQDNSVVGNYVISTIKGRVSGESVYESQGGGYIVIGDVSTNTGTNIYMTRTTNEGAVLWERTFGNSGDNKAGGVLQLEDGSYIFTGSITLDNQSKICLIKTNVNGDLQPL